MKVGRARLSGAADCVTRPLFSSNLQVHFLHEFANNGRPRTPACLEDIMRHWIAAVLSLSMLNAANAQIPLESCEDIPKLAADVMVNRQRNADIMLMLNKMNADLSDQNELLSWAQAMMDMAWAQPIAATPEAQVQQVKDFEALWIARCDSRKP